jgi:hypothetical protein
VQGEEGEVSLEKKKARQANLELLLGSYLSPATAVLHVIAAGIPSTFVEVRGHKFSKLHFFYKCS